MKQVDQTPDTRQRLKKFMDELPILTEVALIQLIGCSSFTLSKWLDGCQNSLLEKRVKIFMAEDGRRLFELSKALETAKTDRVALHQERAAILQKARIHVPSKQSVPSPIINN